MMGWLTVVILIFGALSLISPAALQQGWPVGLAGLLIGGLAGLLAGEALGYGLARREQTRLSVSYTHLDVYKRQKIEPVANIELYQPVSYSGQTMMIRYARAQELGPWLDLVAAKGEVFVQFWLKRGEQPVFFDLGNDPPADPIPAELKPFL